MLQWWLPHHRLLFDHGILINHGSTDGSIEVCKRLAPDWDIFDSKLGNFDALDNDFEVMSFEAQAPGWKMALNVTEFLICPNFRSKLQSLQESGISGFRTQGVVMVDQDTENSPDTSKPLVIQKQFGFIETKYRYRATLAGKKVKKPTRQRLIHRYMTGGYSPGRHSSFRQNDGVYADAFTLWYGFCPWDQVARERKQQFSARIPQTDRSAGMGFHHLLSKDEFQSDYSANLRLSRNLSKEIPFQ